MAILNPEKVLVLKDLNPLKEDAEVVTPIARRGRERLGWWRTPIEAEGESVRSYKMFTSLLSHTNIVIDRHFNFGLMGSHQTATITDLIGYPGG